MGDEVRVDFSLRGREWQGRDGEVRYFNSLDVWTMAHVSTEAPAPPGDDAPLPDDPLEYEDIPF